ncbi:MAG TPA: beta-ketoacyl synthase N-terminal-like domain-containing protein [Sphingobacteriaceae bacterium]|nr:beta-ketoacyl synthase N-terminal-like domain-containing protein [Sphingobacteriaceae bacterium]
MTQKKIAITGFGALSPAGFSASDDAFSTNPVSAIKKMLFSEKEEYAAPLTPECEAILEEIRSANPNYKRLDKAVIMAIAAGRQAVKNAGWSQCKGLAVNVGSSRGPTHAWESFFREFEMSGSKRVSAMASPFTTAGNIASWVSQDIQADGLNFSHSLTCGSALHAIGNALAWLKSGMCDRFLAGASEAPLTDFTVAQMKALRIYSSDKTDYPCKPFNRDNNTMVLGEAAAMFCIERGENIGDAPPLAWINGFGTYTEPITTPTSINSDGEAFYYAMKAAAEDAGEKPDIIIAHAPGTIAGDSAEWKAVEKLFNDQKPYLYSNKWQIGHTFGAAGAMNIVQGLKILQTEEIPVFPYQLPFEQCYPKTVKNILINVMGFGGNAVSIMLSKA